MRGSLAWFLGLGLILIFPEVVSSASQTPARCLRNSGHAATKCLRQYGNVVQKCRLRQDELCEEEARAEDGTLDSILTRPEITAVTHCSDETANALDYLSTDDVTRVTTNACADFSEDLLDIAFADDVLTLANNTLRCQKRVSRSLNHLRNKVISQFGQRCFVREFSGGNCNRERRDRSVERTRDSEAERILKRCGNEFLSLGLSELDANATLQEHIDEVLDRTIQRSRHFAQMVHPPNNLGPSAAFGPFPVGVSTLGLTDPNRLNVPGDGPRPVTTEVYYPSTDAAVAGVPGDIVTVLGIPVVETPAFRDVDRASGSFPLVMFSHGNGGIRFQSFFFAAHLASHGYIVITPDHHGNTFVDVLGGNVDATSAVNRPLDMSFLIDQFEAFNQEGGNFFEGAIDPNRIGMSGHSFGGYTTFALAGPAFGLGTFTEPRIKAIFPQAPAAGFFPDAFFASISVPTLIIGGSIDETTPFPSDQQRPFDEMVSGASVVGLAELNNGGHFTFSDFCEVDRALLAFLGGFDEACEPRHLPWRHAHDIINFLSLNFFDGVLKGDATALGRLDPNSVDTIEDLRYERK